MAEPRIVFCAHNHIYDAALHSECPYCMKIAQGEKELAHIVDDGTDETELLYRYDEEDDEYDHTELIDHKERKHSDRYIMGWIVFRNGAQKGTSLELYEINHLCFNESGVFNSADRAPGEVFSLTRMSADGCFYLLPARKGTCMINGLPVDTETALQTYDIISAEGCEMVFVSLVLSLVGWEV